jgi:hypothetical protein
MPAARKDPTEPLRVAASEYPGVDQGTACTQSSFKAGKKAFLYVGEQGGRSKAMFKLQASLDQAAELAKANPADVQVGSNGWVTARFSAEKPMPKRLWKRWLDESYALSLGGGKAPKKTSKAAPRKSASKPVAKKAARTKAAKTSKPAAKKTSKPAVKRATKAKAAKAPKPAAKKKPAARKPAARRKRPS